MQSFSFACLLTGSYFLRQEIYRPFSFFTIKNYRSFKSTFLSISFYQKVYYFCFRAEVESFVCIPFLKFGQNSLNSWTVPHRKISTNRVFYLYSSARCLYTSEVFPEKASLHSFSKSNSVHWWRSVEKICWVISLN